MNAKRSQTRRSRSGWRVWLPVTPAVIAAVLGLANCGAVRGTAEEPWAAPAGLDIDGQATFTVIQRETRDVPGSSGRLKVKLGDITGGQVLLSVATTDGETLIERTSVRKGDTLPFKFGGEGYALQVVSLVNFLVGDDFGTFRIAAESAVSGMEKIERLLGFLERSDVVFLRNGEKYAPARAAAHLRMKLDRAGSGVATLEDFIEEIASRSSVSGKPYLVKLPDGTTVTAGEWLREQAGRLGHEEAQGPSSPQAPE